MRLKTPRYTDLFRFTRPYRHAKDTDVAVAFAAEYRRLAALVKKPRASVTKIARSA